MASFIRERLRIDDRLDVTSNGHIMTTNKGDIIGETGTNTVALSVGINDQVLVADSTEAAGINWKTLVASNISDFGEKVTSNSSVSANSSHSASSNNPHSVTRTHVGLSNVHNLKVNLSATTDPSGSNDTVDGFSIGSVWINVTDKKSFMCIDNSTSAAIWTEITNQGEITTATNIGSSSGVGLYKQMIGTNLEFKKLGAGSSKMSIFDDSLNNKVNLDVVEANININSLSGAPNGAVTGTTDTQVLSNKTFVDSSTIFQNNVDSTKKAVFQLSGISTGNIRTYELPDKNTSILGDDSIHTVTNKTFDADSNVLLNVENSNIKAGAGIDAAKIANGSVSNTEFQFLSMLSSYAVGVNDIQVLNNKTFTDNTVFQDNSDNTKKMRFQLSGLTTGKTVVAIAPDASFTMVGTDTVQTLTNKIFGNNIDMNNNKIINLASPTDGSDVATKGYVDGVASGLDPKDSVRVSTVGDLDSNISISGTITYNNIGGASSRGQITATLASSGTLVIDGITMTSSNNGNRVLLRLQSDARQNGIWTITISGTSLIMNRSSDFDFDSDVTSGAYTFVEEGDTCDNCGFVLSTPNPIVIGGVAGTSLDWSQFSGTGQIIAGTGMTKEGNTLNVVGSTTIIAKVDSLEVNSSNTVNQVLLSIGVIGSPSIYGALPLNSSNSVSGVLPISRGGTGTGSYLSASKIIATNSANSSLETTTISASDIVTLTKSQTITNKIFEADTTIIRDKSDTSKKIVWDLSGLSTGFTRIYNVPDGSTTLLSTDLVQTISNKIFNVDDNTLTNIGNSNIKSGANINATKIANGTVTNTEFQYLNTVKSSVVGVNDTQILTNKTFTDSTTYFQDSSDNSKKLQLQLSGITSSTTRILTVPDANTTIVGTNTVQTLISKTLSADVNTITNIANSSIKTGAGIDSTKIADGSVTNTEFQYLGSLTSLVVGVSDTQVVTNKTFTDNTTYFQDNVDSSKKAQFQLSSISSGVTRIFTLPDATTTIVCTDTSQVLTSKSIDNDNNSITNLTNASIKSGAAISATKIANGSISNTEFQYLNGITSGVVSLTDSQTLLNKTVTSPKILNTISDGNGNELIKLSYVSAAVNEVSVTNAIATTGPILEASGNDTSIDLNILSKGSGSIVLDGLKWPNSDGTVGQVLKTSGTGQIGFADVAILTIDTVTTTNNSKTTLTTLTTSDDTVYMVDAIVAARRTDNLEGAGYALRACFRNNGGTLTKIADDTMTAVSVSTPWTATIDVSGANILVHVTGENSKTINWKCSYKVVMV